MFHVGNPNYRSGWNRIRFSSDLSEVNDGVHKPFFWKVNAVKNVLDTGNYDWVLWTLAPKSIIIFLPFFDFWPKVYLLSISFYHSSF